MPFFPPRRWVAGFPKFFLALMVKITRPLKSLFWNAKVQLHSLHEKTKTEVNQLSTSPWSNLAVGPGRHCQDLQRLLWKALSTRPNDRTTDTDVTHGSNRALLIKKNLKSRNARHWTFPPCCEQTTLKVLGHFSNTVNLRQPLNAKQRQYFLINQLYGESLYFSQENNAFDYYDQPNHQRIGKRIWYISFAFVIIHFII